MAVSTITRTAWPDDDDEGDSYDRAKRLLRQMMMKQQIDAQIRDNADALRRLDEKITQINSTRGVGYGVVAAGWEPHGFERVPPPAPAPPPTIRLAPGLTRHISLDDEET